MQYKTASYDVRLFGLALTPSLFSSVVCFVLGLVFVGAIVLNVYFKGSFLPIVFFDWGNLAISNTGDVTYGIILQDATNKLSAFTVWALFGLFMIAMGGSAYGIIRKARRLGDQLTDQRLNRKQILFEAFRRLGVQGLIFILWTLYAWVFFKFVFVYVLAASATGASDLPRFEGVGFIIAAVLILICALHMHVVFLRLLILRPRVFGAADYLATQ